MPLLLIGNGNAIWLICASVDDVRTGHMPFIMQCRDRRFFFKELSYLLNQWHSLPLEEIKSLWYLSLMRQDPRDDTTQGTGIFLEY